MGRFTLSAAAFAAEEFLLLDVLLLEGLLELGLLLLLAGLLLLLLLLLVVLLLLEEGTWVCGGECELRLPTLPSDGGGEFNADDSVELSADKDGCVTW